MKMNPLTHLHERRKQVVALHQQGLGIMHIVRASGLSYPAVRAAIDRFQANGLDDLAPAPRGRRAGEGRSLSPEQEQHAQALLQSKSPRELGLDHEAWTRLAVAQLIEREFGVTLTPRGAGNYRTRWGLAPMRQRTVADTVTLTEHGSKPQWGPQMQRRHATSQTLAGKTAYRLRRDIITHQFSPGERLVFDKLSRVYDVGSSPLREALFQVMGEGLVQGEEHKGFVVAPINVQEMLDISSLRAEFEALALRQSVTRGDDEWETQVLAANHRLKKATALVREATTEQSQAAIEEWEARHRQLHSALCSACGSPWLLHFIDILYEHLERYRRYFWNYNVRVEGADDEHDDIVQAALARDADAVVRLLQAHFQTQAELSMLTRRSDDAAGAPA